MIKKTKKPHGAIFALILEDAIFGYCPFPRLSLIPNAYLKDGSCSFMVSYGSVLFSSLQFKFAQCCT